VEGTPSVGSGTAVAVCNAVDTPPHPLVAECLSDIPYKREKMIAEQRRNVMSVEALNGAAVRQRAGVGNVPSDQ